MPRAGGVGLGLAAIAYVAVDYLREVSPTLHSTLQPLLWGALALAAVVRVPFYRHWDAEIRAAIPFVASLLFMLSALIVEALAVQFVTAVLGLDWHRFFVSLSPSLLVEVRTFVGSKVSFFEK